MNGVEALINKLVFICMVVKSLDLISFYFPAFSDSFYEEISIKTPEIGEN